MECPPATTKLLKNTVDKTSTDNNLHIHKASAGSIDSNANAVLTLEDDGTNVLQFLSPNDQEQQIRFGDVNDDGAGFIAYAHSTNKMSFGTAGPTKMSIDSSGNMELAGNFTPDGDNDADLGSASKRWANLFVGDLELSNEGSGGNDVDGTEGKWTIQEGEENLYLLNRKNNKKYKFLFFTC